MPFLLSLLLHLLCIETSQAFAVRRSQRGGSVPTFSGSREVLPLNALIYGWDEDEDDNSDVATNTLDTGTTYGQCSPAGAAVAEALSYDPDRVGSLARLAVAFAPPRQGLSLDIIEKVDVLCVNEGHIDIQVIICEGGGCMTVAVPITFPKQCTNEWLEGCVAENLQQLDESAQATLNQSNETPTDDDDLCILDSKIAYPDWWIPPGCDEHVAKECNHIRSILNEDEFKQDIVALAQVSLNHAREGYIVEQAKVAAIGPAGLCFKVRALDTMGPKGSHLLDALYPFGGEPLFDPDALRAAVLGLVATAD